MWPQPRSLFFLRPRPAHLFFRRKQTCVCVVVAVVVFLMLLSWFFMSLRPHLDMDETLSLPGVDGVRCPGKAAAAATGEPFALLTALCKWNSKRFLLTYVFPFVLLLLSASPLSLVVRVFFFYFFFDLDMGKSDVCPRFPVAVTTSPLLVGVNRVLILSVWCKCKWKWAVPGSMIKWLGIWLESESRNL